MKQIFVCTLHKKKLSLVDVAECTNQSCLTLQTKPVSCKHFKLEFESKWSSNIFQTQDCFLQNERESSDYRRNHCPYIGAMDVT